MEHLPDGSERSNEPCRTSLSNSALSSPKNQVCLLDLTPDLLRATAYWLPPRDRLNLALACRHLYSEVWGPAAIAALAERFPIERRVQFDLAVDLPAESLDESGPFRMVPQRSRQQHVNVSISSDGAVAAVLPYDNKLRLVDVVNKRVDAVVDVAPAFSYDVWDMAKGRRKARCSTSPRRVPYADEAGLDVEVGLEFSADDALLVVSGRTRVSLYRRVIGAAGNSLRHERDILLDDALLRLEGSADYSRGVGGAATLSPDGMSLAWVVFSGSPPSVFVTFWDVLKGRCRSFCKVTTLYPLRWSALGWARVAYSPNGRYCLLVVNAAKKKTRVERMRNEYRHAKLCRYVVAVFDAWQDAQASSSGSLPQNAGESTAVRRVEPVRKTCEWLELGPEVYARHMAGCVGRALEGLRLHVTSGHAFRRETSGLSRRQQMYSAGVGLNSLHSCLAEATYKGLTFGTATGHKWFVSKQPMYSLHFGMCGGRVLVATSPHANAMQTLRAADGGVYEEVAEEGGRGGWRDGPAKRRQVFRRLPWRTSFATVTGFSATGRWVVGAALLDDDRCCVCVRNVTMAEHFG